MSFTGFTRDSRVYADLILMLISESAIGGTHRSVLMAFSAISATFRDTLASRSLHASANKNSSRPPSGIFAPSSAAIFAFWLVLSFLDFSNQSMSQSGVTGMSPKVGSAMTS